VLKAQRPISSTNSNLQTTTYTYPGPTTTISDPYGNEKTVVTDLNGWLRRTTDAYGYQVTLGYDAAGSKTSVTDNQSNTLWTGIYAYGVSAFLTNATDIDMGAWSYTVDALGERTGWTDAKGQTFSMTYDGLSRPQTRTEPDLFTQWTWGSSASSHNIGNLASVCTGTGTNPTNCTSTPGYAEAETYDSLGRLSQRAITVPVSGAATTFTYSFGYNSTTGFLNTLTYPTSTSGYAFELQYGYQNGYLESITDISDSPNVTVWTANCANAAGQITQETLGSGILTQRTYDADTYWLGSIQSGVATASCSSPPSSAAVKNLGFAYDEMGDVTQRQDNNLGLTENIYYDDDYRLSYTELGSTENLSISYGATGNITSRSDIAGGASWTYSSSHVHQVTQAGSSSYAYGYDANGNMTSRQGQTITWSSYNYPTAISAGSGSTAESVNLYYGPDRQRWYQYYSGNSTTEGTYYIGGLLEMVNNGSVTNYRHYIYAGGEPVSVYSRQSNGTNTFYYTLSDHQGSVSAITNSSAGVVVNESFTPYGNRRNPTTWSGADSNQDLETSAGITRQGYTFQTQLGLWMGMNHMNGRVQDSLIGRFMSADPFIQDPTNPQDYNRYSYVNDNPVSSTDPTGFDCAGAWCPPVTVPVNATPIGDPDYCDLCSGFFPWPNPDNPQAGAGYFDFFDPQGLSSPPAGGGMLWSPPTGVPSASAQQAAAAIQTVMITAQYPSLLEYLEALAAQAAIASEDALVDANEWWARQPKSQCSGWGAATRCIPIRRLVGSPMAVVVPGGPLTLYRGVPSTSPAFQNALNGLAIPRGGPASMLEHIGFETQSSFTSWTSDWEVAFEKGTGGYTTSGVVLQYDFGPGTVTPANSVYPYAEEIFGESEFLATGPVSGAIPFEVVAP
jgi:RHS repeat-associated protein